MPTEERLLNIKEAAEVLMSLRTGCTGTNGTKPCPLRSFCPRVKFSLVSRVCCNG